MGKSGKNNHLHRLIVACDGSWMSANSGPIAEPTNVVNLCRSLSAHAPKKKIPQIVFYQSGVGTGAMGPIQHLIAGATGNGLAEHVLEAYLFLADNYSRGDHIYLFGFSRGAYTARSIAAFVGWLGILTKQGLGHLKAIYQLYQEATNPQEFANLLEEYIKQNCLQDTNWRTPPDEMSIKVVGCWDTVGSLGIPEGPIVKALHLNDKYRFLSVQMPLRVEHAFHAIALDEHRSTFYPSLWWLHPDFQWIRKRDKKTFKPEMVQCWFPGHHGDIGGGTGDRLISNMTLAWMVDMCNSRGLLDFDLDVVKDLVRPTRNSKAWAKSMDPFYATFFPRVFWTVLGSRLRQPGREPLPTDQGAVEPGSSTYEYIHYSVREKMEEMARKSVSSCESCAAKILSSPSRALDDYTYDWNTKVWVGKDRSDLRIPETKIPDHQDKDSVQAWLSENWIQTQGVGAVGSKVINAEGVVQERIETW